MVAPCTGTGMDSPNPIRLDLSCDLDHAASFPRAGRPKPQRQDRLTGSSGLYMNYSMIFTEISFYPETSFLLQIIRIIHMTFRNLTDKGGRLPGLAPGQP